MIIAINKSHLVIGLVLILLIIGGLFLSGGNVTGNVVQDGSLQATQNAEKTVALEGIDVGKVAKDFSLVTIDGDVVKLSDFRGKYVLFASMATWCTPCQIEAANVKRAQDNFEHFPLEVMQIDVDYRETNQDLIRFRNAFGKADWIMGFDDGTISQLYNIRTFDTTIIVDPDGKIVYRDNGFPIDTKTLEDLIIKGESTQLVLGSTHEHAKIKVVINGEQVDFSQQKYQLRSSFAHFEGGDGNTAHKHANGVTIGYLFGTLGWEYSFKLDGKPCLRTDFDEFCDGNLKILVNGDEKNLDYEFVDNDNIEVIYK